MMLERCVCKEQIRKGHGYYNLGAVWTCPKCGLHHKKEQMNEDDLL